MKTQKCIICNVQFKGYGHNPEPIESSHFRCCNTCNETRVIPYRLYSLARQ